MCCTQHVQFNIITSMPNTQFKKNRLNFKYKLSLPSITKETKGLCQLNLIICPFATKISIYADFFKHQKICYKQMTPLPFLFSFLVCHLQHHERTKKQQKAAWRPVKMLCWRLLFFMFLIQSLFQTSNQFGASWSQ